MARARTLLAPNFSSRGHALIPTAQVNRRHHRPLVRKGGEDPPGLRAVQDTRAGGLGRAANAETVDYFRLVVYALSLTPPATNRLAPGLASGSLSVVHSLNLCLSDRTDVFSFWTACR